MRVSGIAWQNDHDNKTGFPTSLKIYHQDNVQEVGLSFSPFLVYLYQKFNFLCKLPTYLKVMQVKSIQAVPEWLVTPKLFFCMISIIICFSNWLVLHNKCTIVGILVFRNRMLQGLINLCCYSVGAPYIYLLKLFIVEVVTAVFLRSKWKCTIIDFELCHATLEWVKNLDKIHSKSRNACSINAPLFRLFVDFKYFMKHVTYHSITDTRTEEQTK